MALYTEKHSIDYMYKRLRGISEPNRKVWQYIISHILLHEFRVLIIGLLVIAAQEGERQVHVGKPVA
jgi:hypothetical protein